LDLALSPGRQLRPAPGQQGGGHRVGRITAVSRRRQLEPKSAWPPYSSSSSSLAAGRCRPPWLSRRQHQATSPASSRLPRSSRSLPSEARHPPSRLDSGPQVFEPCFSRPPYLLGAPLAVDRGAHADPARSAQTDASAGLIAVIATAAAALVPEREKEAAPPLRADLSCSRPFSLLSSSPRASSSHPCRHRHLGSLLALRTRPEPTVASGDNGDDDDDPELTGARLSVGQGFPAPAFGSHRSLNEPELGGGGRGGRHTPAATLLSRALLLALCSPHRPLSITTRACSCRA
jgi:hypothetical protein